MIFPLKPSGCIALLIALLLPALSLAQPDKSQVSIEAVDTCGEYILYGKPTGSTIKYSQFYLENSVTHSRITLSMTGVYRYDFDHGFLVSYGPGGVSVFQADGTPVVQTGMPVIEFLSGDSLFATTNFNHEWRMYAARGELLASGEGVPWYGFTFEQVYDSLIVVPGPNQSVGLINTSGIWLALPVFSTIEPAPANQFRAAIGRRYGTLEPNGIFHEPDSSITVATARTRVRGMGDPCKIRNEAEGSRIPGVYPTISDIFHEYIIASDPQYGGYTLSNSATGEVISLTIRQSFQSFSFDFPFIRMKYFSAPVYKEALLDLKGTLLAEEATYINVVRNGDSTVIVGSSREWFLYDWKMNLLNSSAQMHLPEGEGQNIRDLSKGLYAVSVRLDSFGDHRALYEIADRSGRVITEPVFTFCYYHNSKIHVEVCNGQRAEIDTAGNVYYSNDTTPHRITRESLLSNPDYRSITIEKPKQSQNKLGVQINPYCYDRHTVEKAGQWEVESWYENGQLVARHKRKQVKVKDSNSIRTTYRVTEIAIVYRHGKQRKRVQYKFTPSWF